MLIEYNSNTWQLQVFSMLKMLKIETLISENKITKVLEGLTKSATSIEKTSPQCLRLFVLKLTKSFIFVRTCLALHENSYFELLHDSFIISLRESLQLEQEVMNATKSTKTPLVEEDALYQ